MRVLTWNLWWQFGPWEARQPAIEAELGKIDPDIALFQEVYCDDTADQAARLGEVSGLNVARTLGPDGKPQRFGNAILSRWPILSSETLVLPNTEGEPGHRTALLATIQTPQGDQLVVSTHLEWRYDQSVTRMRQLEVICAAIAATRTVADGLPTDLAPLLGGDFNAEPDSDEIRSLTGRSAPHHEGLIFTDSWAATNLDAGHTWTRANANSKDAQWPNRRLDYVFVAWPRIRPQMNPVATHLAGLIEHEGVSPSDHYAVVATLDDRPPHTSHD